LYSEGFVGTSLDGDGPSPEDLPQRLTLTSGFTTHVGTANTGDKGAKFLFREDF
jgi:hypothetical protein